MGQKRAATNKNTKKENGFGVAHYHRDLAPCWTLYRPRRRVLNKWGKRGSESCARHAMQHRRQLRQRGKRSRPSSDEHLGQTNTVSCVCVRAWGGFGE